MNLVIAGITLRQLLSRRRTALLLLLAGLLVLIAIIYRLAGGEGARSLSFSGRLLSTFGLATLMPLVALLFGTGAIGPEIDDGTVVYLLSKPIPRRTIIFTKLAVAALCSILLTSVPILVAGLIAAGGPADGLVLGFTVGSLIGSVVYCAIFVALSLVTGRALIFGLLYVLIWEGLLAALFAGTRTFSVRQQSLAFADAIANAPPHVLEARLPLATAAVVAGLIFVIAVALAIRRLSRFEIAGERG
jgi:ABC-2 type transport system permease protein